MTQSDKVLFRNVKFFEPGHLSNQMLKFKPGDIFSDLTIITNRTTQISSRRQEPQQDSIKAHKKLLHLTSKYFRQKIVAQHNKDPPNVIILDSITTNELGQIFKLIYRGEIELSESEGKEEFLHIVKKMEFVEHEMLLTDDWGRIVGPFGEKMPTIKVEQDQIKLESEPVFFPPSEQSPENLSADGCPENLPPSSTQPPAADNTFPVHHFGNFPTYLIHPHSERPSAYLPPSFPQLPGNIPTSFSQQPGKPPLSSPATLPPSNTQRPGNIPTSFSQQPAGKPPLSSPATLPPSNTQRPGNFPSSIIHSHSNLSVPGNLPTLSDLTLWSDIREEPSMMAESQQPKIINSYQVTADFGEFDQMLYPDAILTTERGRSSDNHFDSQDQRAQNVLEETIQVGESSHFNPSILASPMRKRAGSKRSKGCRSKPPTIFELNFKCHRCPRSFETDRGRKTHFAWHAKKDRTG